MKGEGRRTTDQTKHEAVTSVPGKLVVAGTVDYWKRMEVIGDDEVVTVVTVAVEWRWEGVDGVGVV